jgi:hypothetical protein
MSYPKNPRFTKSKFASDCAWCGAKLRKENDIFYFPSKKIVLCFNCGQPPYKQFLLAMAHSKTLQADFPNPFISA